MLNLLSDESDDEQDVQHVYSPCCRNGLYTAQTKLAGPDGGRLSFRGLFASKSLCVGAFVVTVTVTVNKPPQQQNETHRTP